MTNEQLVIQIQAGANVADNMLRLWQQNRRFIFKMANKYRGQAEEDDLVQEGYLGLCRAVDGYDSDLGVDFLPYAGNWIRQGMVRFIHNSGTVRIAVHEQESLYRYRRLCNTFMMELGRETTDRETGHYLGLGHKAVCRLKRAAQMASIASLDAPVDEEADTSLSDTVAAPGDVEMDTLDKVQAEQLKAVIWPLVDALPGSQPQALRARYQDGEPLADIAADLGCSYQRAAQICREGLRALRRPGKARIDGKARITATRNNTPTVSSGAKMIAYGDPNLQDVITGVENVDTMTAYINVETPTGTVALKKTSEDGVVAGISFTIKGDGFNKTVKTDKDGNIMVEGLFPGTYTVTEQSIDRYESQKTQTVTIIGGKTSTVTFSNTLKRGSLEVVKTSEDNLVEGVKFHLYGMSLSGLAVDEYAITDKNGLAKFENVLTSGSTPYTLEEVDTAVRYVVPASQTAPIEWKKVTNRSFHNILKKFNVTVLKTDVETGKKPQGDVTLAGAVYGIYKGEELVDTYTTDENGKFTTKYYICGNDWSVREITPSEGYLLDTTIYHVGAEPELYTVEYNSAKNDVNEQVIKGNIAIIKHTDNGETQIETPEEGAVFEVYLKSAGGFDAAEETERDTLICDENGFAQTKDMPYGIYTVHQTSGWDGRELIKDFDVFICKDSQTYRYLINNANFESYIKIVKKDVETGKVIPYAGAGFQIYDPEGNLVTMKFTYPEVTEIDTFYTTADGGLITPQTLEYGKGYSLVEVQAPYGYVLDSEPVYFDVEQENSEEESGITIVKVERSNVAQKGKITVSKSGEVFSRVSGNKGLYQPIFDVDSLEGAV